MQHRGFTLIEVIVSMVLLATLLATSIVAIGRQQRQLRFAKDRVEACSMAESILASMETTREGIPSRGNGPIVGKPSWIWQTRVVGSSQPFGVRLSVIRFAIAKREDNGRVRELVRVEVLR
ncbi:MAG: prepilin-type N-terminal cleavage/methylation domain-containing protein [Planctomycetota bacterium]